MAVDIGTMGVIVAVSFFLVFLGIAYVAWKALRKTAKMAFRLAVVGIIMAIAVAGSASLWYFSGVGSPKLKPPVDKRR
jgi:hypothetical protein